MIAARLHASNPNLQIPRWRDHKPSLHSRKPIEMIATVVLQISTSSFFIFVHSFHTQRIETWDFMILGFARFLKFLQGFGQQWDREKVKTNFRNLASFKRSVPLPSSLATKYVCLDADFHPTPTHKSSSFPALTPGALLLKQMCRRAWKEGAKPPWESDWRRRGVLSLINVN